MKGHGQDFTGYTNLEACMNRPSKEKTSKIYVFLVKLIKGYGQDFNGYTNPC